MEAGYLFSNNGHRFTKKLFQNLKTATEENKNALDEAAEPLIRSIEANLDLYLNNKAIFVVISILENSDYAEKVKQTLVRSKQLVDSLSDSPGVKLLRDLVFN